MFTKFYSAIIQNIIIEIGETFSRSSNIPLFVQTKAMAKIRAKTQQVWTKLGKSNDWVHKQIRSTTDKLSIVYYANQAHCLRTIFTSDCAK